MKVYKSSSFAKEFASSRNIAIKDCIEWLRNNPPVFTEYDSILRYTWCSDDGSGFTIVCTKKSKEIYLSSKWNAARK